MSDSSNWEFFEQSDPMDDMVLRAGLVQARTQLSNSEDQKLFEKLEPGLACRVRIRGMSILCETGAICVMRPFSG